mmetsp:Transcript_112755/g.319802  ORF Transcript_112755/g.319802 Transcript_112755/m.319802 type:complete len:208 (+) Transcript_112755:836-1459(+)
MRHSSRRRPRSSSSDRACLSKERSKVDSDLTSSASEWQGCRLGCLSMSRAVGRRRGPNASMDSTVWSSSPGLPGTTSAQQAGRPPRGAARSSSCRSSLPLLGIQSRSPAGGGPRTDRIRRSWSRLSLPPKTALPAASSPRMHPAAQMSTAQVYLLPSSSSGARYSEAATPSSSSRQRVRPKLHILRLQFAFTRILLGRSSRCTRPAL